MMNKKGSLGITLIVTIMFFMIGLMAINYLTPEITNVRLATTGLGCSNTDTISDGTKLTCLAVDLIAPYFILLVISTAGAFITAKFIL